eukprot:jgi/Tetstr1/454143/TSEL_041062.t1
MKRNKRTPPSVWRSLKVDPRLVLAMKAGVLLYSLAAPFVWGAVDIDMTPVYIVALAVGSLSLAVDPALGCLVMGAVVITMVTVSKRSPPPSPDAQTRDTFFPVAHMSPVPDARRPAVEGFESHPAPSPDAPEPPAEAAPPKETSDGERAPEDLPGPTFLLKPDGKFVTDASLRAAQTNEVGPNDAYCPLGLDSYSVQGRVRGVGIVPMAW